MAASAPRALQRSMAPEDITRVVVVDELDVTRDGRTAVVAVRVIRRGRYERHLRRVDLVGGSRSFPLTAGRVLDGSPAIAPDGSRVAFTRSDPDDDNVPTELWVVSLRGGSPRRVAPRSNSPDFGSVSEVAWSPDGRTIAFTAATDPSHMIVGRRPPIGSRAARAAALPAPTARRITRADWRWDGEGHRDHRTHLFVIEPASSGPPRQLTRGDWDVSGITWHPDGRTVAFVADPAADADVEPRPSVWAVDIDAGPRSRRSVPRPVLVAGGGASRPAYSPDGRWLAAVGVLADHPLDDISPRLLLGPADGARPAAELTPALDRPIGNWTDTDLDGWMVTGRTGPVWLDACTIAAVVTDCGRSLPERWTIDPVDGECVHGPTPSERATYGPWADATTTAIAALSGGRVATLGTLSGRAVDVMEVDLAAEPSVRRFRTHTTLGSRWQRRLAQPRMERVDAPGDGGPIETWIASPPDAGNDPLPTIVDVHGGPLGCWAPSPSIEVIMLTGAGYRVVLPNIRGSTGYGAEWIRPQLGDWGGVDASDVHAALDHAIELGLSDAGRLGALGLSYGGFMVNWLVGTSDRFAAAVSENGVANQLSAWANSDSGPEYCRAALMGDPLDPAGVERLWRQSPLRHVAAVRTPLLLLQAESDLRCPPSDSEQFFVALRHLRRTVEYVLYPEESHVYAATGRPDRRIDRMSRVLDWFNRYLR